MNSVKAGALARDIMAREPVCVEPSMSIRQLARVFEENEISGAPVVDRNGRLIGIVSKTDLIHRCAEGTIDVPPAYLFESLAVESGEDEEVLPESMICVEDCMTEDPVTVTGETPVGEIAQLMYEGRFHRVVVIDDGRFPIGIITSMDLLGVYPR